MKYGVFALVLGLIAGGCSPSKELESEMKSTPPVKTPPPAATATASTTATTAGTSTTGTTASTPEIPTTPSTTTGSTTTASGSTGTPSPTPTPPPVDKSADNPNRAFQLRSLAHASVKLGGHPVDTWVMDTKAKREEGMMFLTAKDVKEDQGMVFIFDKPQTAKDGGFWMKNTILPLDIIYVSAVHKVLNIQEGKPFDEKNLPPAGAYTAVVELKQGQAAKLGIKPGTAVEVPKDLKATE